MELLFGRFQVPDIWFLLINQNRLNTSLTPFYRSLTAPYTNNISDHYYLTILKISNIKAIKNHSTTSPNLITPTMNSLTISINGQIILVNKFLQNLITTSDHSSCIQKIKIRHSTVNTQYCEF